MSDNPLIAQAHDSTTWHTGLGLIEDATQISTGIHNNSWVDTSIGTISGAVHGAGLLVALVRELIAQCAATPPTPPQPHRPHHRTGRSRDGPGPRRAFHPEARYYDAHPGATCSEAHQAANVVSNWQNQIPQPAYEDYSTPWR